MKAWRQAGLPEVFPDEIAVDVSARCTATTHAWVRDTDHLMHLWLALLDPLSQARPAEVHLHCVAWAFLRWGQYELPDLIDETEDPDHQQCLDRALRDVTQVFDMADMLAQFERLDRAREPEVAACPAPLPRPDTRTFRPLEPHVSMFLDQRNLLHRVMPPVLAWPVFEPFLWFMVSVLVPRCLFSTCTRAEDVLRTVMSG